MNRKFIDQNSNTHTHTLKKQPEVTVLFNKLYFWQLGFVNHLCEYTFSYILSVITL